MQLNLQIHIVKCKPDFVTWKQKHQVFLGWFFFFFGLFYAHFCPAIKIIIIILQKHFFKNTVFIATLQKHLYKCGVKLKPPLLFCVPKAKR